MNRREFIKAGSAGAFFIAGANRLFGEDAPSSRLRLAIVGCHERGRGFAVMKNAVANPGIDVAVVCDVDSRAMDFAADWLVKNGRPAPKKEKDFRKVLEMNDVDGVISETPDHFHAYSAVMAMRAGKAVYVEKPCAFCPAECEVLLDTWKKTGGIMQVGSQRRSQNSYRQAIEEIRAEGLLGEIKWAKTWYMSRRGPIGNGRKVAVPEWLDWDLWQGPAPREAFRDNVVHYNWHWFRNWGTGECGNNAPHFLDVARWTLGEEEYPVEIGSTGGKFWIPEGDDWEWPDTQMVTIRYRDGRFITWEGLSATNAKPYMDYGTSAMVYGTKGEVFFQPWNGDAVILYDLGGREVKRWQTVRNAGSGEGNRTSMGAGDPTVKHLANWAEAIRTKNQLLPVANADVGVKSSFLALAANVAHYAGGVLRLDPKTGRPVGNRAADALWSREYAKGWEI